MEQKKAKLQQGGQLTSDRPQVAILDFGSQFSYAFPSSPWRD